MVKEILARGMRCDFEDMDRPPYYTGCTFRDMSDPEGFLPPLVRAIKHGETKLVRLLLKDGANPNVAYHDLPCELDSLFRDQDPVGHRCGRAVHLAMELGHLDIVQLLLSSGSDIGLAHPVRDV